jgi:putative ABC transport system ATP-binding protein
VVFADEPTAALDPVTAGQVRDLLRSAVDELGQSVVLVTHEPGLAGHADRALLLHAGRLVADVPHPDAADLTRWLQSLGGPSCN